MDRYYENYVIGETRETQGRTITEADVVIHAGQTGDFYPHHVDAQWCATQPIGERIAHGTLTFAVAVGLTAGSVNRLAMSYGYDRIRFLAPVRLGDTIHCVARITQGREHGRTPDRLGVVDELVEVRNQHDDIVLVFTHLYLVEREPAAADDVTSTP